MLYWNMYCFKKREIAT